MDYGNRYQAGSNHRRYAPSFAVVVVSLLLHAALIAFAITGLSSRVDKPVEPLPIPVKLVPAESMDTMQASLSMASAKPAVEKKSRDIPPVAKPVIKPAPKSVSKPTPPSATPRAPDAQEMKVPNPDASVAARPAPSGTSALPAAAPAPAPQVKTGVSIPASYAASNRKPTYPSRSRQYEEEGTVVLRVLVKDDGTAGTIEIKSSSGYALLDESAKAAVRAWRFNPATSDGKPVSEWFLVPIPFTLQS